ncbi:MAG: hypothetical protein K6E39_04980 [Lachnospiraceae bacterium]|nr:hypothetical protein [Lachnospiraceae bacterium]
MKAISNEAITTAREGAELIKELKELAAKTAELNCNTSAATKKLHDARWLAVSKWLISVPISAINDVAVLSFQY